MSVGYRVQGDHRSTGVLTGHGGCSQTSAIRFRSMETGNLWLFSRLGQDDQSLEVLHP